MFYHLKKTIKTLILLFDMIALKKEKTNVYIVAKDLYFK